MLARARATRRATREARVVLPRGRARAARRAGPTRASARCREVTWAPEEAPTAAEWERALAAPGPRRERAAARARSTAAPLLAHLAARERRLGERARALRRLPGQVAGGEPAAARGARARPRADGPRRSYAHAVLEHTFRRAAPRRRASRRVTPANLAAGRAHPARGARRAARRVPALPEPDARPRRRAPARVRPAALPAPRGRARRPLRARAPRAALRLRRGRATPVEIEPGLRVQRAHRPRGHQRRHGARDRLQERQEGRLATRSAQLGVREPLPGRALHAGGASGCSGCAPRAASTCRSAADEPRPRGHGRRRTWTSSARASSRTTACRPTSSARSSTGRASSIRATDGSRCARASSAASPTRCA